VSEVDHENYYDDGDDGDDDGDDDGGVLIASRPTAH
jgi:hypothetical protein